MTRDIDVMVALQPKDVETVVRVFSPDYFVSAENVRESVNHPSIFNLIHRESVIKAGCIVRKQTEYRVKEFERRKRITILDFSTFIVSREDLIISQLFWAKDSHSEVQLRRCEELAGDGIRDCLFGTLDAGVRVRYVAAGVFE